MAYANTIYNRVISEANKSPCKKRRFGCVAVYNGEDIAKDHNRYIDPLAHLCNEDCIRLHIDSGTESLIGACGHAEERVLWKIAKMGYSKGVELFVAGYNYNSNKKKYEKTEAFFYCLRCAIAMYYAGIDGVNVWVVNHWEFLDVEQAIGSALLFSMKIKKVDDLL